MPGVSCIDKIAVVGSAGICGQGGTVSVLVLAVNQELLLRDLSNPGREVRVSGLAPASSCEADDEDPRDQLRRLVERIHGRASGFRGGLSVDQSAALRLLLRSERTLDPKNPWRETYDDSL